MLPTLAETVHYTLNEHDAKVINGRRDVDPNSGNRVHAGADCAAVVVAVWGNSSANLKVLLDGADSYWAMSKSEGDEQGHWRRQPRV